VYVCIYTYTYTCTHTHMEEGAMLDPVEGQRRWKTQFIGCVCRICVHANLW